MPSPVVLVTMVTTVATVLIACSPGAGGQQSDSPAAKESATVTAEDLPPISSADLRFGLALPEGPTGKAVSRIAEAAEEAPATYLMFKDFEQEPPLHELDVVAARGAQSVIAWEPWTWDAGVEQPEYSLKAITAGDHDDVLTSWGQALGDWGKPVTIRFAHEMNGNWYPWGAGVNGNETGDYVDAYRHVHDVVTAAGADNVSWMWSPNVLAPGAMGLEGFYPGDEYVDVVGVDGYNWGTSKQWSAWQPPQEIFDATFDQVRTFAPDKPIVVAEVGSIAKGGDQGQWIRDLVAYLDQEPGVEGFIWLHAKLDVDWRLKGDSLDDLRDALAARD